MGIPNVTSEEGDDVPVFACCSVGVGRWFWVAWGSEAEARARSPALASGYEASADRAEANGEFVDGQALAPEGTFVRYDGEGRPPVTDGPFAETKDLIAGWMVIDVDTYERALELAGELSAAPGAGGRPIHEWLEVRPFLTSAPAFTE